MVLSVTRHPFPNDWRSNSGDTYIAAFELHRLLATKMRARYRRCTARDLFDLVMELAGKAERCETIRRYVREIHGSRGESGDPRDVRVDLAGKIHDTQFHSDTSTLLRLGFE